MSRRQQIIRMLRLPAVLGCAAALVLTGCAAGPNAETLLQRPGVNGSSAEIGSIALRDVVLAYPGDDAVGYRAGEDAPLGVTIVNSGNTLDQLVSVTSPVAGDVVVQGRTTIAGGDAVSSAADATPVGTAAPSPSPARPLRIVLTDLREPIRPGLNTPVTFAFRRAGQVTLPVPINAPLEADPAALGAGHPGHG